jgi:hypothetical protein
MSDKVKVAKRSEIRVAVKPVAKATPQVPAIKGVTPLGINTETA